MAIILNSNDPAIVRGIKTAGIGKRGSQDLSQELIDDILEELKSGDVADAVRGAFFGSLMMKGMTREEARLGEAFAPGTLQNPLRLVEAVAGDAPDTVKDLCVRLLAGKTLDRRTAKELGNFLLSDQPGSGARGLTASILRVRYETPEEYDGLLEAMQETLEAPFREKVPEGDPIVQLSEPFDGVDHSYLITPLLARHIQARGYRVLSMMGRNSGPKTGINLLDIADALDATEVRSNTAFAEPKPELGWFCNQRDLSQKIDRWVDIRRQIIKRPFLATLEKFLNPARARVVISSAFHPPYTEKMITVCEHAGFPGAIVIRNGIEGTLGFALKRPVKIMCSARQSDGRYQRYEFEIIPEEHLAAEIPVEEKITGAKAEDNARLIVDFTREGTTENPFFNHRVTLSCLGLDQAFEWLEKHIQV